MELATLTFSIAVPIATVVIGYFIQPTLSGWCWRGFLKLSEQIQGLASSSNRILAYWGGSAE